MTSRRQHGIFEFVKCWCQRRKPIHTHMYIWRNTISIRTMETANGLWRRVAFQTISKQQHTRNIHRKGTQYDYRWALLESKYLIEIFLRHWACRCCQTHICRIFINHCYYVVRNGFYWNGASPPCCSIYFTLIFNPIEFDYVNGHAHIIIIACYLFLRFFFI